MDHPAFPILETERLRLRPFRESDLDDYAALCADPEVTRWLPYGALARDAAWRHLVFTLGHWLVRGSGLWAVEEKATATFVGRLGFSEGEGWPGFELAWALVPCVRGRGYATEGAEAALAFAFRDLQRGHVISLIRPDNLRSIRVAEQIGERLERSIEHLGKPALVYGIDREGWEARAGEEASLHPACTLRWPAPVQPQVANGATAAADGRILQPR